MIFAKRAVLSIVLIIGLIVAGFIFLLRGCLAKYDERSGLPGILYFEKDGKQVIFSIVKYEKATSYSQKGGITSKSVSTNYFIQNNDAVSGQKIAEKKIMHQREIKNHPVEILGASGQTAWLFMNELMAVDPFTLEQKAALPLLEEKNPPLKGKFPAERRYYSFDQTTKNIFITARDGSTWMLNTSTMLVSEQETGMQAPAVKNEVERIEEQIKLNRQEQDSLFEQKLRNPSRLLAAGKISRDEYNRLSIGFNAERDFLFKQRDSLQQLKNMAEKAGRNTEDIKRKVESLQERSNIHFSQIKVNADTANGHWYGLYSNKEIDKLYNRFQYQAAYDETARRQLYTFGYSQNSNGDIIIEKDKAVVNNGSSYFLDAGFLLDKQTGMPVRFKGISRVIVHKNQIGNDGRIQISLVNSDGRPHWAVDSGLKEWANYVYTGGRLIIIGTDNKELSGYDCNLLLSIDMATGKTVKYDYFTDQGRD